MTPSADLRRALVLTLAGLLFVGTANAAPTDGLVARLGISRLKIPDSQLLGLSPDGKTIVTVSQRMVVREWDAATGKTLGTRQLVNAIRLSSFLSPDGRRVLSTASEDPAGRSLELWDVAAGRRLQSWPMPAPEGLNSAAFGPDGESAVVVYVESGK